jgi:hypothetical protein
MAAFIFKILRVILIKSIFFLGITTSGLAATYYVAPDGSDNNPGTSSEPFRTLQKSASVVRPGDTVIVKDGTYTVSSGSYVLNTVSSGTADKLITFRAQNKYGAVIDGTQYSTYAGILIDRDYTVIDGFEIRKTANNGIMVYGSEDDFTHHVIIKNCRIHDIARYMVSDCTDSIGRNGIITRSGTSDVTIENCKIYGIGRIPNPNCEPPTSEKCTSTATCTWSNTHNYKHDHGVYAQGKRILIQNNLIYDHHAGRAVKVDGYNGDAIGMDEHSHIITNNTFGPARNGRPDTNSSIGFYSNYVNKHKPQNVLIQNNIIYDPEGPSAVGIGIGLGGWPWEGTVIRNNITSFPNMYCEYNRKGEPQPKITDFITESGNLRSVALVDFLLRDPENKDFHLLSGSPAIGKGNPEFAPLYDFEGNARILKQGEVDVGAYQYNKDTSGIISPTNLRVIASQ